MSDVPRSLQSWVSTIHTVVLTANVFQHFIKYTSKYTSWLDRGARSRNLVAGARDRAKLSLWRVQISDLQTLHRSSQRYELHFELHNGYDSPTMSLLLLTEIWERATTIISYCHICNAVTLRTAAQKAAPCTRGGLSAVYRTLESVSYTHLMLPTKA